MGISGGVFALPKVVVKLVDSAGTRFTVFGRGWLECVGLGAELFHFCGHGRIGFADLTVNSHRRLLLHQVSDVGVNVQHGYPENVTNACRQGFHIHAVLQRHRGEGMTEVMEPHIPQIPRKTNLRYFPYHIIPIIQTILFR